MSIKEQLYRQCLAYTEMRFETINNTISEIQESMLSETKSSAGDKHETGRAMLQLEREKAGSQLAEIEKTKQNLSKINIENSVKSIGLGSVVFTTQFNYFIAISAGELTVEDQTFYAISANTPIGKLLIGKSVGDVVNFRNMKIEVVDII
ncbi:GreA/GreB family elongation factor [Flavobacteriaceae bacterium GSB9]|nr:GreA/GreB family elongation factor [Flavobacteriaceae bacterium GSB9]